MTRSLFFSDNGLGKIEPKKIIETGHLFILKLMKINKKWMQFLCSEYSTIKVNFFLF